MALFPAVCEDRSRLVCLFGIVNSEWYAARVTQVISEERRITFCSLFEKAKAADSSMVVLKEFVQTPTPKPVCTVSQLPNLDGLPVKVFSLKFYYYFVE